MNNERRKQIAEIISELEGIAERLGTLQSDEQSAFYNMPEGLQQSERGQQTEQAADNLQSAFDEIYSVKSYLEDAQQ